MNIHRSRFVDFTPHTITRLAFSHPSTKGSTPSDLRLAVGRNNGDIEIWNPRFGWFQEQILKGGKGRTIEGLAWSFWSNTSLRLFSIGGSSVITEWDLKTGMPLKNYDCNSGIIWFISVNKTNDKIAVGCDNGSVVLVDISGGPGVMEHDMVLQRQNSRVLSVDFNGDSQVVGGCADGKIRVWDISGDTNTRGRLVASMKVDKSTKRESTLVWSVLVLDKQNQIISGDSTGSLKIWDLKYFTLLQSFDSHKADILSLTCDLDQEKIFSAGVDRKIINFNLIANPNSNNKKQWVNSLSKLYHSNDIRSLTSFESKGLSLLVSGGVDRQIAINSIKFFNANIYRKLPITTQYQNNLIRNSQNRLIIMWQDQTVKIWKLFNDADIMVETLTSEQPKKNYKLVSKLALSEEENISDVAVSSKGDYLAVAYLSNIKIFKLNYDESQQTMKVFKLKYLSSKLENVGARIVTFSSDGSSLVIVDSENDIMKINIVDYEQNSQEDEDEGSLDTVMYELPDIVDMDSKLGHAGNIKDFKISDDDKVIAVSRHYGALDLIFIDDNGGSDVVELARLSTSISAIEFTKRNTLIAITVENKIYEFNIRRQMEIDEDNDEDDDAKNTSQSVLDTNASNSNLLLTNWSKKNSENLPNQLLNLKNKCVGIFPDLKDTSRIWFWGADWICFINLNANLQNKKNRSSLKRKHDGLSIYQEGNDLENEEVTLENFSNTMSESSKLENNQLVVTNNTDTNENKSVPFWFTNKYNSILFTGNFETNDLLVVERPVSSLASSKAFKTNHIAF